MVNNRRIEKFKQRISDTMAEEDLSLFKGLIEQYQQEQQVDTLDIAAALAKQMQGSAPFLLSSKAVGKTAREPDRGDSAAGRTPRREQPRDASEDAARPRREQQRCSASEGSGKPRRDQSDPSEQTIETGMDRFRIEVGHQHKVKPGNIVGAIANEADIDSKYIGRINIFEDYSLVDLPENMPKELLRELKNVRVAGQRLNITLLKGRKRNDSSGPSAEKPQRSKPKIRHRDKKNKGKPKRARQR